MNKKQLIIAWVMGVIVGFIFLANVGSRNKVMESLLLSLEVSVAPLIIGSLLIYTLRDKKK